MIWAGKWKSRQEKEIQAGKGDLHREKGIQAEERESGQRRGIPGGKRGFGEGKRRFRQGKGNLDRGKGNPGRESLKIKERFDGRGKNFGKPQGVGAGSKKKNPKNQQKAGNGRFAPLVFPEFQGREVFFLGGEIRGNSAGKTGSGTGSEGVSAGKTGIRAGFRSRIRGFAAGIRLPAVPQAPPTRESREFHGFRGSVPACSSSLAQSRCSRAQATCRGVPK